MYSKSNLMRTFQELKPLAIKKGSKTDLYNSIYYMNELLNNNTRLISPINDVEYVFNYRYGYKAFMQAYNNKYSKADLIQAYNAFLRAISDDFKDILQLIYENEAYDYDNDMFR